MPRMTKELKEAAKILRKYQDWRTGRDNKQPDSYGITPKKLSAAIDTILDAFNLGEPGLACTQCQYYQAPLECHIACSENKCPRDCGRM